ncbi:MAG: NADH-quinone oxidoreductase subunit A [Ignavibacteria bacterium]|jgi:NADH-quinone oxidoreductase subunit A|nr:NADH-quinone oxidoreductase subunit A [Ignavibacteria bacterium]MBM4174093.1 NADH-quinone oxidoreductase subunit A [Ignavibacteria bacterium]NBO69669.1 NADH-quinone oxidoreductase subunit A [bacterium]NBP65315.1 NADH-quinone oxidoreductase subunit A [Bacteroidota bacterium]GDX63787.1 NADH-quinone oxidoreductase subunit A 1 [Chlorobiota bacterium]
MFETYLPLFLMIAVGFIFGLTNILIAEFVGPRKNKSKEKLSVYECGMEPIKSARERFSVKFYLVAMLFILFDIEIVFMYPWAIQFQALGMVGLVAMALFMVLLFAGYIYVLKKGALEWQ